MNIFIFSEGGQRNGLGHLSRCVALVQGISRFRKIKATFVINGDKNARDFIRKQNISSLNMLDWLRNQDKVKNLLKEPHMVIIDSYLAPRSIYDFIYYHVNLSKGRLVCIDDYNRINYPPSIVLNPSIYGNDLNYRLDPVSCLLTGRKAVILRKDFWDIYNKSIKKKVKDILVTFGGVSHISDFAKKIVSFISDKYPRFKCHFIKPALNLSAEDITRLMRKCDICISGGGQTIYELAKTGLPTIGVCLAENQCLNLEAWKEKGFVEYIGWFRRKDIFKKLECSIERLLPYKERLKRSKIGTNAISRDGMTKLCNSLLKGF